MSKGRRGKMKEKAKRKISATLKSIREGVRKGGAKVAEDVLKASDGDFLKAKMTLAYGMSELERLRLLAETPMEKEYKREEWRRQSEVERESEDGQS